MKKIYVSGLLLLTILLAGCGNSDKVSVIIEGRSMEPTLNDGDRLTIDKGYYDEHEIERGDMVLYKITKDQPHVKRVIGLPGERIQMENGRLLADGEPVDESFIFQEITYEGLDIVLEENAYFILGDAMDLSRDSRHIGPVLKKNIIGKVIKVKSKH